MKKFRIRPRRNFVVRTLKTLMGVKQLPRDVEVALSPETDEFLSKINPMAFYKTWSGSEIPPPCRDALREFDAGRCIALSAVVATIGLAAEDYLSGVLINGEAKRAQIITALSEESADVAFQFIAKLLADNAKSDDSEIGPPLFIKEDVSLLSDILTLMQADEEGISLDSAMHLSPRFTRVALIAWHHLARRKRHMSLRKK